MSPFLRDIDNCTLTDRSAVSAYCAGSIFNSGSGFLIRQQVQQSVRSLPDIANSLMKVHQQRLPPLLALVIEYDSLQMPRSADSAHRHGAHEEISLSMPGSGRRSKTPAQTS